MNSSELDDACVMEDGREGVDYVVCPDCGSHVLLEPESGWLDEYFWGIDEDVERIDISFVCDWDPCGEDFTAEVHRDALAGRTQE